MLISPKQSDTLQTYNPPLPERFRINGCLRLEEKLWLYDVFDQYENNTARLWLEEAYKPLDEHRTRALSLKKLSHKNIWAVYDHLVIKIDEKQYYAIVAKAPGSEYVTLRTLFASSINIIMVGQIIRQLALALNYCHSQGVLHSHLEPMFIWIGLDGTVRLELFSALENRPQNLLPGKYDTFIQILRSAAYSSPEQFGTKTPKNVQAEIYSLGVLAYELLAGFNPFLASSDMASQLRHVYKAVPPLHQINHQVGSRLETAIMLALTKNSDGRYATMLDFLADFEVGLASTLQAINPFIENFTMEQLIENHKLVGRQTHSFLTQTVQKSNGDGKLLSSAELPTSESKAKPVIELDSYPVVEPLPQVIAETDLTKSTFTVPQQVSTVKPTSNKSKPNPQIISQPTRFKTNFVIPWLLVLNLFFMGYVAWLLLNTPTTSELPQTTNPPTRFLAPTANRKPPILPVTSQTFSPQTSRPGLTETPHDSAFSSSPTADSTLTDPHVLTALAPTVTPDVNENSSEVTANLTPEDLLTPAITFTPEPFTVGILYLTAPGSVDNQKRA